MKLFMILAVLCCATAAGADYHVANYFEGRAVYDIKLYGGRAYCCMREGEGPTSIVRFDPATGTSMSLPDISIDEREDGTYEKVRIALDKTGKIWCGCYGVLAFDGETWTDRTPPDFGMYDDSGPVTWIEVSPNNEIYMHYSSHAYDWFGLYFYNYIHIYQDATWKDFADVWGGDLYVKYLNFFDSSTQDTALLASNGDLWCASIRRKLICLGRSGLTEHHFDWSVDAFAEDPDRNVWFAGGRSLAEYTGDEWHVFENDDLTYGIARDFSIGPDNTAWIAYNGCLVSFDGAAWTLITNNDPHGLPSLDILSIEVDYTGVLYIGTANGLSIWTPQSLAVGQETARPRGMNLTGYPNPFNGMITLSFENIEATDVRLVIYDVLGRRIQAFSWQGMGKGIHHVSWNGRDAQGLTVSSGVYIAHFVTSTGMSTYKMMYVR